jgi:hypothetical protein
MKRKSQYAGIPANERERVRKLFHLYQAAEKSHPQSPQQIYRSIIEGRKARAENDAKLAAARTKENAQFKRKSAQDAIEQGFRGLAILRDFLEAMADNEGNVEPLSGEDSARWAHLVLIQTLSKMERGLYDLGVIGPLVGEDEGWFVENYPEERAKGGTDAA